MTAEVKGNGKATIKIKADGNINIAFSKLTAEVKGTSRWSKNTAEIIIDSKRGDVSIFFSQLKAEVKGNGKATISIDPRRGGNISISGSDLTAEVKGNGEAKIKIKADGNINIAFSKLTAEVKGTSRWSKNTAEIIIDSKRGNVSIFFSQLKAEVKGNGKATISIEPRRGGKYKFEITIDAKGAVSR